MRDDMFLGGTLLVAFQDELLACAPRWGQKFLDKNYPETIFGGTEGACYPMNLTEIAKNSAEVSRVKNPKLLSSYANNSYHSNGSGMEFSELEKTSSFITANIR